MSACFGLFLFWLKMYSCIFKVPIKCLNHMFGGICHLYTSIWTNYVIFQVFFVVILSLEFLINVKKLFTTHPALGAKWSYDCIMWLRKVYIDFEPSSDLIQSGAVHLHLTQDQVDGFSRNDNVHVATVHPVTVEISSETAGKAWDHSTPSSRRRNNF